MHQEDASATQEAVDRYIGLLAELREEFGAESQPYKAVTGNWAAAQAHHDVIVELGRYPARNAVLGRPDTRAE